MNRNRRAAEDAEIAQRENPKSTLSGTACLTLRNCASYIAFSAMTKWLTTVALIAVMLGGSAGVGAHEQESSCPLSNMPDCCKKAQEAANTPSVSMARLCCKLNCSQPGSGGPGNASNTSSPRGSVPTPVIIPNTIAQPVTAGHQYSPLANSFNSNPKYIQHLALLI